MNAFGHRVGRWSMVTALSCAVLAAVGFGTPTGVSASTGKATTSFVPTPLATSVQSSAGTWATLPMGRLNQPLNTFWQLFFRPTGMTTWSDKVGATATATNGGLVMAAAVAQPFIVGVRPANLLQFSPLIATTDGGNSWSNGLLPQGLADSPDSLSLALHGRTGQPERTLAVARSDDRTTACRGQGGHDVRATVALSRGGPGEQCVRRRHVRATRDRGDLC
jgi:hypothetical protein